MSNDQVATKEETIVAGIDMLSRATPTQRVNHEKVIAWIKTLRNVPSTTNAVTTYKQCVREWYAVYVERKPGGTGAYTLDTL